MRLSSRKLQNVDGKDVDDDEAESEARKERMKQVKSLTFLLNIKKVGEHSCAHAVNLIVVQLPEGITHILKYAFGGCENLNDVRFPKLLTSIGLNSFSNCSNLGEVDLRKTNLQELGEGAFNGCSNLTSVFIPDSLQKLGGNVFYNCSKLVLSQSGQISDSIEE